MTSMYLLYKFLHVTAVTLWFGGAVAIGIVSARVARSVGGEAVAAVAEQSRFVGRVLIGPSVLVTLLSGIAMVVVLGGMPPWAGWGVVVVLATATLGILLGRFGGELGRLQRAAVAAGAAVGAPGGEPGAVPHREADPAGNSAREGSDVTARERVLRRRVAILGALNMLLLLSAVWAMVFKPGA